MGGYAIRNMSFMLTERQMRSQTKCVTRRIGWKFLKAGDRVRAVKKALGLRKGEKQEPICEIEIVSTRREALNDITIEDVTREGYPGKSRSWFIDHFCKAMKCQGNEEVSRIEFRYLDG